MKKNSGLTLAELLVIIVVIGLILTLTITSISTVLRQTKKNIKETEMKTVYEAAKSYLNDVVEGDKTFRLSTQDVSGYSFLEGLANCTTSSICETTKDGDSYTTILFVPMKTFKEYLDTDKFNISKCSTEATIKLKKNSYGYYELSSITVDKDSRTNVKAETCVK